MTPQPCRHAPLTGPLPASEADTVPRSFGEVAGDKELLRGCGPKGPEGFRLLNQLQDLKSGLSP